MSEVENTHYMSKEMHESLKHPEAVYKELDKTGKKLVVLHDCDDCKHRDYATVNENEVLEADNQVILNALVYIRINSKAEAYENLKTLYARAYRKGFEAGKKEGTVKIKEIEVPEKHYTTEEIDGWNGGGA